MKILRIINHYITLQNVIKGCKHNKMSHKVCNKSLKLQFYILKKLQEEHNKLDSQFLFFLKFDYL